MHVHGPACGCGRRSIEIREAVREDARREFARLPVEDRAVAVAKALRMFDEIDRLSIVDVDESFASSLDRKANVYGADVESPIARPSVGGGGEPIASPRSPGVPRYLKPIPFNDRSVESILDDALSTNQPRLVRWLYSTWNAAAEPLKYQEIRNALRDGEIGADVIEAWRGTYASFVETRLSPVWRATALASHGPLDRGLVRVLGESVPYEAVAARLDEWIAVRGTELAVSLTDSTHRALRAVLREGIVENPIGARDLGRYLRPLVGLTPGQATAVERFRASLIEEGLSAAKVTHRVENYAGYLSRVRAERIARTEISFAFNRAGLDTMRTARDSGLVSGRMTKELATAKDERVCPFCAPLNGAVVELEETFPGATKTLPNVLSPPLHPNCRCAVLWGFVD